ncbi:hypothetical protein LPJ38_24220 [Bradyrhizobium daqingense]|nr:hypothetical protein [Bradyrhizobium daqingense]UFS86763.1 hypothetical protein LPJ38_24220 [Bradyrhizobium daqingense]
MPVVISFHDTQNLVAPTDRHRGRSARLRSQAGTFDPQQRWPAMTDPELRAQSFEIAWRYLDQSGLLTGERKDSARFILNRIDRMMLRGERRRLLLSNAAIDAYRLRPLLVTLDA